MKFESIKNINFRYTDLQSELDLVWDYSIMESGIKPKKDSRASFIQFFIVKAHEREIEKKEIEKYLNSRIPDYQEKIKESINIFYSK